MWPPGHFKLPAWLALAGHTVFLSISMGPSSLTHSPLLPAVGSDSAVAGARASAPSHRREVSQALRSPAGAASTQPQPHNAAGKCWGQRGLGLPLAPSAFTRLWPFIHFSRLRREMGKEPPNTSGDIPSFNQLLSNLLRARHHSRLWQPGRWAAHSPDGARRGVWCSALSATSRDKLCL